MATRGITAACRLNDGVHIPYLGLGVYESSTCQKACLTSFDEGYRHIDTAQLYGNEADVGVRYSTIFKCYADHTEINPDRKPSKPPPYLDLPSLSPLKSTTIIISTREKELTKLSASLFNALT